MFKTNDDAIYSYRVKCLGPSTNCPPGLNHKFNDPQAGPITSHLDSIGQSLIVNGTNQQPNFVVESTLVKFLGGMRSPSFAFYAKNIRGPKSCTKGTEFIQLSLWSEENDPKEELKVLPEQMLEVTDDNATTESQFIEKNFPHEILVQWKIHRVNKKTDEMKCFTILMTDRSPPQNLEIDQNFLLQTERLQEKLFNSLELVHYTLKEAPNKNVLFINYSQRHLSALDTDGKLLKHFVEVKKQLVVTGIQFDPTSLTRLGDLCGHEALITIIDCVGYPERVTLPSVHWAPPVKGQERKSLELTFGSINLASSFLESVEKYWRRGQNIPVGFEEMKMREKKMTLPAKEEPIPRTWSHSMGQLKTNRFHKKKLHPLHAGHSK